MSSLFTTFLFQPLFNVLVVIYNHVPGHDFGIAIIILTLTIRLLFTPLSIKASRSQYALSQLQPKLKDLQEKHKNDKQALGQATMALYKEYNINPLAGCLPLLIQIPVLLGLYRALNAAFKPESLQLLYSFVHNPGFINEITLGFINIVHRSAPLAITAGVLQWVQLKLSIASQDNNAHNNPAIAMNKQLLYFFPVMVIVISWKLPTGIVIYWVVTTLYSILEQLYIKKRYYGATKSTKNH